MFQLGREKNKLQFKTFQPQTLKTDFVQDEKSFLEIYLFPTLYIFALLQ